MKIILGADHGGFQLKERIKKHLRDQEIDVEDCGTHSTQSVDYPDFGQAVGQIVARGKATFGIIVCGTGIGISIAANKVPGVRAAVCTNCYMARMAREHNDANVLALGERVLGPELALAIVDSFLTTAFAGGRHAGRVAKLEDGTANPPVCCLTCSS